MKNQIIILVLLIISIFCSCTKKQDYAGTSASIDEKELVAQQQSDKKIETKIERKLIKEGDIRFQTADINQTKVLIIKTVQVLNGYISKENIYEYSDRVQQNIIIRIPADHFDLLLKNISENVKKLDAKNIEVLDVTEEYVDIDARIKTKKEIKERYTQLLKQAKKIEEILKIEKEIGGLETEIESIEGRMKYLKDRISYSTLTVTYYQKTSSSFGFSSKFTEAIQNGWNALLLFFISIANLWAFILIGCLLFYFFIRYKRKKQ